MTACRGRDVIVIRLIRAEQGIAARSALDTLTGLGLAAPIGLLPEPRHAVLGMVCELVVHLSEVRAGQEVARGRIADGCA